MIEGVRLHSELVQGRLAYAMRRSAAARRKELGLQILTPPLLAARLSGGMLHPASRDSIENGIHAALVEEGLLEDLDPIRELPGVTRALVRTLRDIWRSGFDLRSGVAVKQARVQDLATIEDRVRRELKPGECLLPDLYRLALDHLDHAQAVLGSLHLEGVHSIDPLWHPLIDKLRGVIDVTWAGPAASETSWFKGEFKPAGRSVPRTRIVSCTDPAHEAIEALRWARWLMSTRGVEATDIAIVAAGTAPWDDDLLALRKASDLPLCFVHGIPVLTERDGQRCAALADVLINGPSQARVRRLLSLVRGQGTFVDDLPNPLPIPEEASLSSAADWARATHDHQEIGADLAQVIELLEGGPENARAAADRLLKGRALKLWSDALRAAPAAALMFSLQSLRLPDGREPGDAIVWCSADQLAAAPRRYVWLMGLTTSGWPRTDGDDPVLPGYIVPRSKIDPDPLEAADRRTYNCIVNLAEEVVLSSGRLSREGKRQGESALLPTGVPTEVLHRDRTPEHAVTESDRQFARPYDVDALVDKAGSAWRNWQAASLTANDGLTGDGHPLLDALLTEPQSPTSLSQLFRDPLAYVWHYGLGWRDLVHKERPLVLPPDDFGKLVHELLRRTVDALEPSPGFASAAIHEIEEAMKSSVEWVTIDWPLQMNVPPHVLWVHTVRQAGDLSIAGLTYKRITEPGTRSWTEVPFGGAERRAESSLVPPWDPETPVHLPGTDIRIYGNIDRLDLRGDGSALRVTDYKAGKSRPKMPESVIIHGGRELQRALYALACSQLLPDVPKVVARLIYLREPLLESFLPDPDDAVLTISEWATEARRLLEAGTIYPGVVAGDGERFGRLALPAAASYLERKDLAIRTAAGSLARNWVRK